MVAAISFTFPIQGLMAGTSLPIRYAITQHVNVKLGVKILTLEERNVQIRVLAGVVKVCFEEFVM